MLVFQLPLFASEEQAQKYFFDVKAYDITGKKVGLADLERGEVKPFSNPKIMTDQNVPAQIKFRLDEKGSLYELTLLPLNDEWFEYSYRLIQGDGLLSEEKNIKNAMSKPALLVAKLDNKTMLVNVGGSLTDVSGQPESGACGFVSVFFSPLGPDLYPASITEVNGKYSIRRNGEIKLPAGKHQLLIHEGIPSNEKRRITRRASKGILIEFIVEPNKRYHLAAKFNRKKQLSNKDDFWKPYVWKEVDVECSL